MQLVGILHDGSTPGAPAALPEIARAVVESNVQMYSGGGATPPWIGYLAFEGQTCVGTCAFKSAPVKGAVEIAYFTFPGHESRGVATAMAHQLVEIAVTAAPEVKITAQTMPAEGASTRILRRNGFVFHRALQHPEDGPVWEWLYAGNRP